MSARRQINTIETTCPTCSKPVTVTVVSKRTNGYPSSRNTGPRLVFGLTASAVHDCEAAR